jgi:hypothetical protein
MNKEQVIEGNKLIAEFMGWEYHKGFLCNPLGGSPLTLKVEELIYHSSWDWLMPVVIKIFQLKNIEGLYKQLNQLTEAYMLMDKKYIYKSVIQFIQWYNQQSK